MRWGRAYFAVQATAGAAWWVMVFASPTVRILTLGALAPVPVAAVDVPFFVVASALAALGMRWAAILTTGWTVLVATALVVYATITTEAGWGAVLMSAATAGSVVALSLTLSGRIPSGWIFVGPFSFRPAVKRSSATLHVVATLGQIVVFWSAFLLLIPLLVVFLEQRWRVGIAFPPGTGVAGAAVFGIGSALGLWSAAVMAALGGGTPLPAAMANRLVIAGPYRYVRNPMAVASIGQGVAVGLILSSWLVVAYAVAGALLWNYAVRPREEADLDARFGAPYRRYRAQVRCWIPSWPVPSESAQAGVR